MKEQIGLEASPQAYVDQMVNVFREVKRVLREDGTVWLNLGDSYAGSGKGGGGKHNYIEKELPNPTRTFAGIKAKDLIGIPWQVVFALRADGWFFRCDIVWNKSNALPESVRDRPTRAHEYIFLLSKSPKYFYDIDAIREPHKEADKRGDKRVAYNIKTKGLAHAPSGSAGYMGQSLGGRNKRTVWTVPTRPYSGAHFAVYPTDLI